MTEESENSKAAAGKHARLDHEQGYDDISIQDALTAPIWVGRPFIYYRERRFVGGCDAVIFEQFISTSPPAAHQKRR